MGMAFTIPQMDDILLTERSNKVHLDDFKIVI